MLKVGELAPDIDAPATDGNRFRLSDRRGKYTVVYFFPRAFTPGCTDEAGCFRDSRSELVELGADVVGISTDTLERQRDFALSLHADFPMIGDPDEKIVRAYGVKWPLLGAARRATFVIGPTLHVEAVYWHELRFAQHIDDVVAFLKGVRGGPTANA